MDSGVSDVLVRAGAVDQLDVRHGGVVAGTVAALLVLTFAVTAQKDIKSVSVDQIIAAAGPRIPSAADARNDIRIAIIYLVAPGGEERAPRRPAAGSRDPL